jgi:integrase
MARVKLTKTRIEKVELPAGATQVFLWDSETPQLAARITSGRKAYIFQSRLDGRSLRVTIGKVATWAIEKARIECRRLQTLIDQGKDPREVKAEEVKSIRAKRERDQATVAAALEEYVEKQRRKKDQLPLKDTTKADYLKMIAAPRLLKNGKKSQPGMLYCIANKPIHDLTAKEIKDAYAAAEKRGARQAAYAMQILRAVLNWHGVNPEGSPFDKSVAAKHRIAIPTARASKKPIPAERIGEWWNALGRVSSEEGRDYFKFLSLTGCRVREPMKILAKDCDLRTGRLIIRDTKNRRDHEILLSRQAMEIVERNISRRKPGDTLFSLADGKRTKESVAEMTGYDFRPKDTRSTFATIASRLVNVYVLKRLMNHTDSAQDVTSTNYVEPSDEEVRAGWQAVADFIEAKAREAAVSAEVVDMAGARQKRVKEAS